MNGAAVGEWKYGYSSFEHEITDALVDGENEIVVKVVHRSPNSRWYSGAGIYRNVWLKTRGPNWIETDGVYVSVRRQADGRWLVGIDTEVVLADAVMADACDHAPGTGGCGDVRARGGGPFRACRIELIVEDPEAVAPGRAELVHARHGTAAGGRGE